MRWRLRWGVRASAVGLIAALALTACGSESAHYVINSPAQLYFKVPNKWQVFRINGDAFSTAQFLRDGSWAQFFGPPDIDPQTVTEATSPGPLGIVLIGQVEAGEYDKLSMSSIRTVPVLDASGNVTEYDPKDILQSQDDDTLHLSMYQEISRDGMRGFRIRFIARTDASGPPIVYDEVKLIHDATHTYYLFRVACSTDCYIGYRPQIDSIFSSLRIRKDQP